MREHDEGEAPDEIDEIPAFIEGEGYFSESIDGWLDYSIDMDENGDYILDASYSWDDQEGPLNVITGQWKLVPIED